MLYTGRLLPAAAVILSPAAIYCRLTPYKSYLLRQEFIITIRDTSLSFNHSCTVCNPTPLTPLCYFFILQQWSVLLLYTVVFLLFPQSMETQGKRCIPWETILLSAHNWQRHRLPFLHIVPRPLSIILLRVLAGLAVTQSLSPMLLPWTVRYRTVGRVSRLLCWMARYSLCPVAVCTASHKVSTGCSPTSGCAPCSSVNLMTKIKHAITLH